MAHAQEVHLALDHTVRLAHCLGGVFLMVTDRSASHSAFGVGVRKRRGLRAALLARDRPPYAPP